MNKKGGQQIGKQNCANRPNNKDQQTQPECCWKNLAAKNCILRKLDIHLVDLCKGQLGPFKSRLRTLGAQNAQETYTGLVTWARKSSGGDFSLKALVIRCLFHRALVELEAGSPFRAAEERTNRESIFLIKAVALRQILMVQTMESNFLWVL